MAKNIAQSDRNGLTKGLITAFGRSGERSFSGYVMDAGDPARKFAVELLLDGYPLQVCKADQYVHALAMKSVGDGCYGFSFSLRPQILANTWTVEARLANLGVPVGSPVVLSSAVPNEQSSPDLGLVEWMGGLRFTGCIASKYPESNTIDVLVDGALVTRTGAIGWMQIGSADDAKAVQSFDVHVPDRFADGRIHRVTILHPIGEPVAGSPCPFVAFADGLEHTIASFGSLNSEKLRGKLFDRLLPNSVPMAHYREWRSRFPILPAVAPLSHGAVVMVGPGNMDETFASLELQTHTHWIAASLPAGKEPVEFQAEQARAFLDEQGDGCEFVMFGLSGTVLEPTALQRIAAAFSQHPGAEIVYGDVDVLNKHGARWPLAFPAFDYERMLEQGYCAHLFALRRARATHALDQGASDLYRLFNAALDDGTVLPVDIVHIPGAIGSLPRFDAAAASAALARASRLHLRKRGVGAQVRPASSSLLPGAKVARSVAKKRGGASAKGAVSIIIPTRNRRNLLQKCIQSIRPAVRRWSAEIVIVDNDSSDDETLDYLAQIKRDGAKVLRVAGPFNFARLNNIAAEAANGDYICLLNNDVEAVDNAWLGEMLNRLVEPSVGAVGAMLFWPTGVVQHGGVVLGANFAATHAFNDRMRGDPGYGDLLCVAHECSAVTAACLMTRRADYLEVGGMDEIRFPINFNDVDYCLKLRAGGKKIVFTPHAQLLHVESASRGKDDRSDRAHRFQRELQALRARWGEHLVNDPYYNPTLSLDARPFSALAWPPRDMTPRVLSSPTAVDLPPGF